MKQILTHLKNPIVQQNGLEFLFPIIGYLVFEWSFLLIVLFYLVDQLGNQINFFARLRFVQKLFLPKKRWLMLLAISGFTLLFLIEVLLVYKLFHSEIYDCQTSLYFLELRAFFFQEFWLFLPLLVVANFFKDKMTFYKTDLPYKDSPERMLIFNLVNFIAAFILILFVLLVWRLILPKLIFLILIIAFSKLLFDAFVLPNLKLRFFKKI